MLAHLGASRGMLDSSKSEGGEEQLPSKHFSCGGDPQRRGIDAMEQRGDTCFLLPSFHAHLCTYV